MLEAPEAEPHHHHKTGHSHVDLIFSVLAVFLSGVSIFIAVHHGKTMERLVDANSWPNISYSTGNEAGSEGAIHKVITMSVRNTGVGPARIDSFEVFYKDQPVANIKEFLQACCKTGSTEFSTSAVLGEVLPARESVDFITFPAAGNTPADWDALNRERFHAHVRVCYCSVFDECWVRDSQVTRPAHVKECAPSQAVQYTQ